MTVDLHVSVSGRRDLVGQIYGQIRSAIVDGRLRPGDLLPSSRELAARLAVSRTTVGMVYDRLAAEGFVRSRSGAGTRVSTDVRRVGSGARSSSPLRPRPVWDAVDEPRDMSLISPEFDFRTGVSDASLFPYAAWRARMGAAFRPSAVGTGTHIGAGGYPPLRAAIARSIGLSRGLRADAADVLVTSGSQQAVDMLVRVLVDPGDRVAVEDPGYPPVHRAIRGHGAEVVGVPLDAEGLIVDALPEDARLVYVTPSHQFPLGMTMSLRRRLALLDWAERADAVVVEDDYDGEFRYGGRPLEPLHNLDQTGRVLYVGSFSKLLLPILRLGFLVAPPPLHAALRKAKHAADWHTDVPMQMAMTSFIQDGLLGRHVRRMRGIYMQRHHLLRAGLGAELDDALDPMPSASGLHIAATLRTHPDDRAISERARTAGVAADPLSAYGVDVRRPGLVFGYGGIRAERIVDGLRRLRACLDEVG